MLLSEVSSITVEAVIVVISPNKLNFLSFLPSTVLPVLYTQFWAVYPGNFLMKIRVGIEKSGRLSGEHCS